MLKFLIVILGVGWLLGQLIRYFLRSKVAKFAQQVKKAAEEEQRASRKPQEEGEVHVDFIPKTYQERRTKDIKGGDYVDYEEVKE
ncbi:hypothetical protein GCM10007049_13640 [Echinicola pacifica]|uniref:DUF4834 domain-containing protein n=1 Tax=Echinicola pacifica TaxID=346377 RepID=A0A918PTF0_9BACT|nr:DUF4834 family protein [Echinicola pacifica]GGZ22128.1 hypothetical protein GCM10007049_13640 [Echinicola pacifica]